MNFDLKSSEERPSFWRRRIPTWLGVFVVLLMAFGAVWVMAIKEARVFRQIDAQRYDQIKIVRKEKAPEIIGKPKWHFVPGPISMEAVKNKGCVTDGFLSNYGDRPKEIAKMIDRSECVYLHRALETWLRPPKFEEAEEIMQLVTKQSVVYGMFLAEAISTYRDYEDPNWDRKFDFKKMCRAGTQDRWEDKSCVPSVESPEYRRYLNSITQRAMDIGIQSFMFGQAELQDPHPNFQETEIRKILNDMRVYAESKGMQIIIGAQTNSITDEKYLRLFDYIEGGVGIDDAGRVENGPCSSKFGSCWGLLWNTRYKSKANNVLVHLDWSGLTWDDMGIFARMPQERRIATLKNLYQKFTGENVGFLMPFLATLNRENDGCYGPNKNFYAPSDKYKCKDEAAINRIMRETLASDKQKTFQ
ncbi:MAG: hypothetical protein WC238_02975 [Parcubacteria group bacterium]|jgi:hypothetical protein